MKVLFKILVALVLVVVVGLVAAYLGRNAIAGAIVPSVASSVLKVKVDLGSIDLDLGTPAVTLTQLDVGNPAGFTQPYALKMGSVSVKVDGANTSTQKVIVDEVMLDKVGVWFVQSGSTNNIAAITDGMSSGDKPASESGGGGGDIEIVIKRMVLTNMEVNAMLGDIASPTIVLDRLELKDISSKGAASGLTAQLTREIFEVAMKATVDACGKQLPAAITASVGKSLEGAGVAIGNATAAAGTAVKEAAGKAVEEATKGIGDIFGGKK